MPGKPPKKRAKAPGRPRLVNQVLVNRMVALRRQGFSHLEIAKKVLRSERTVRRYLRGVSPRLELPTAPKRVNVLAWCSARIVAWRQRWKLTAQEVDSVIKRLRKTLDEKDPQTLQWFATDPEARREFLVEEFFPAALRDVDSDRQIQRVINELRACGAQINEGEESATS